MAMESKPSIGRMSCLLLLLFFFFFRCSSGLPSTHPLRSVVDQINELGPFLGLVMAYSAEADAVESSGCFVPANFQPYVDLYGRRFHIGTIRGVDVVYVMSGQRRLNAGITVQILLDVFSVRGIVHFGTAGSANDSISFGDVSVPKFAAFTGSWAWKKFNSLKGSSNQEISFGEYNVPAEGKNLLSTVEFKPEELYSIGQPMKELFWLPVNSRWFQIAEKIEVELERCANKTYCLPNTPKVVFGLKASTADVFLDNAAYRKFLFKKFGVSTVDEESAAVIMTAISPAVPVIVFRGVSDLAGGEAQWSSTSLSDLASLNALKVAVKFIEVLGRKEHLLLGKD
ncbi:bark storage protein A-like [Typha latifolia]|uniref:bark storage protein A-like n=1 Tax=Typha latifolia TaxID=4733 RepID=UPI003C2ED9FF